MATLFHFPPPELAVYRGFALGITHPGQGTRMVVTFPQVVPAGSPITVAYEACDVSGGLLLITGDATAVITDNGANTITITPTVDAAYMNIMAQSTGDTGGFKSLTIEG